MYPKCNGLLEPHEKNWYPINLSVMFARQENSACYLCSDRRDEVLETRNRGSSPGDPTYPWTKWKKMFVHYARVCGPTLSAERKHALLMHCLGGEGQEVLENLPDLSAEESRNLNEYEVCIKKMDKHYVPRVSTIMERYYFGKREQGKDESVEEYITSLRKLAASCKFGTLVDERIRDQFVLKCCSDKIREELWLKDEPPLEEVVIVAKRVEHMLKCVKELSGNKVVSGECTKVEEVVCEVKVKEFGAEKKKDEFSKFKGECFRLREDAMEGEKDGLSLQEGDVCEVFCNVSEIMYGAITEQEWEEALKEDVELSEICVALEDGKFSTLGRCVMFARQENSACYLRGDRRDVVLETRRFVSFPHLSSFKLRVTLSPLARAAAETLESQPPLIS
ncbi:hypothetical protein NDU88_011773 [Pleurodeles waltl]|uniref:Retrotransposon gag domain-containing protein n=1 Tax=Pleurodeles waltl TaxID=8319 RepID=A0AAV7R1C9_PLEWA|nr:hypothetical protein NDU88_011773 [Pleurodeles waltl]